MNNKKDHKFNVLLPMEKKDLIVPGGIKSERSYNKEILVVEDNLLNQKVISRILSKLGVTVSTAINGEEAVKNIQQQNFDLVLMDLQMPIMDGYTATEQIRTLPLPKAEIPIVALSANIMPENISRCEEVGMNAFIGKPIKLELIIKELDRYFK